MSSLWVVVPTYNEAENIARITQAVLYSAEAAPVDTVDLLVVDDDSPDGTGEIVDDLRAHDERIHALHRAEKEGLGPAYIAGFGGALECGADYIVEMDADFSHNPADVPRLVDSAVNGADLVLGSRYARGGSVVDWGAGRRVVSRAGCFYARRLLGLHVRDLTGGFKCFRKTTLTAIDYATVRAHGYAFQIEMTWRAARAGLYVAEVPIRFVDREAGQSKMSASIALEAAWRVPAMRFSAGATATRGASPWSARGRGNPPKAAV
jgi:dolichol-phosphate mannosyltransferase